MSSSRFFRSKRRLAIAGCAVALVTTAAACSSGGGSSSSTGAGGAGASSSDTGTVTVAVVSNPLVTGQMIPLTQSVFEKENPGITVKFATYTEGDLRAAIEKDVSTHSNSFNAVMIGPYETPLFAKNGWLVDLTKQYVASDPSYDASDLLPAVAKSLSYKGDLYAAPFYGESSMLFYNKTLLKAAGHHHARAPDLGRGRRRRGQAEQAGHPGGDLPARPGRLGRQHGRPGHGDQHVRRRVVQQQLAGPAQLARGHGGDQLLRQPDQGRRRVRRRPTTASTSC